MRLLDSLSPRSLRSTFRGVVRYLFSRLGRGRIEGFRLFYKLRTQVILRTQNEALFSRIASIRDVRLHVDGEKAFGRAIRLIRRARFTVVIQMFIWKDDEIGREMAAAVLDAAKRGVTVDITKDVVGDLFEKGSDFLTTQGSASDLWKAFWSHPNIRVHSSSARDHAKVYVIDDRTLLLTGMNIGNEYRYQWHDYMVELRGRSFVEEFFSCAAPRKAEGATLVMNRGERRDIRPWVMSLIHGAKKSIVLEHCYLSDGAVLAALAKRSHEGIRIVIILPETIDAHHHANMQSVAQLRKQASASNLQVFIYPGTFHAKVMMVDRRDAFIGSANFIRASLDDMGEVNVAINARNFPALRRLREALREDVLRSRLVSPSTPMRWVSWWLAFLGL